MTIKLYNTLTRKKEDFIPREEGKVGIYSCGPTVYHYATIGNLRSYIFADSLKRILLSAGYEVTHITNITDIGHLVSDGDDGDDKMTKGLKREGLPLTLESTRQLANLYFQKFEEDLRSLNVLPATAYPFASDNIKEDITLVSELLSKGHAYSTSDGVYFDTATFAHYGELAHHLSTDDDYSRTGVNTEKKNSRDFAIWKFNDELGYNSPFGKGFPGWHIECSAMSMKYLGNHFDIHTGGIDHIPVHHTNEIAQSEAATGEKYVNYWLHNNFLNDASGKMSKSSGDFLRLQTLVDEGISPLAYRYYLLLAHFRSEIQFSFESLRAAETAYKKLYAFASEWNALYEKSEETPDREIMLAYYEALYDDMGTPQAIATLWTMLKDEKLSDEVKYVTLLAMDQTLGLNLRNAKKVDFTIPEEVQKLLDERATARAEKDFTKSDELRKSIEKLGFKLRDSEGKQDIELL
jgi:cysteinyl-tRNA synthetase